jgi:hypothetical protein
MKMGPIFYECVSWVDQAPDVKHLRGLAKHFRDLLNRVALLRGH